MRDPRLVEIAVLSDLERRESEYFDFTVAGKGAPISYGVDKSAFKDLMIHLLLERYVEGVPGISETGLRTSTLSGSIEVNAGRDIQNVTTKYQLHTKITHKGRLRLYGLKDELEVARTIDQLTGLYTRAAFAADYEIAWAFMPESGTVTLMEVDLDEFGSINNLYDHSTGDEVLRRLGNTLRDSVGKLGTCYRFGGDEFVVLAHPMAEETASKLAESIRVNVERSFREMQGIDKVPKRPTASIGVGVFTEKVDYQRAYEFADALERTAKKDGKNCVRLKVLQG